jgi:hypothetical protein
VLGLGLHYKEKYTAYSREAQEWAEADKVFDSEAVEEGIVEKALDGVGLDVESLGGVAYMAHSIVEDHY